MKPIVSNKQKISFYDSSPSIITFSFEERIEDGKLISEEVIAAILIDFKSFYNFIVESKQKYDELLLNNEKTYRKKNIKIKRK
jgi:hypothetical protein